MTTDHRPQRPQSQGLDGLAGQAHPVGLCCGGYLDRNAGRAVMTTININKLLLEQVQDLLYRVTRWKGESHEVLTDLHDIKEAVKAVLAAPATAPDELERKPMTDDETLALFDRVKVRMLFTDAEAAPFASGVAAAEHFHGIGDKT